jgi:hypothetical protein
MEIVIFIAISIILYIAEAVKKKKQAEAKKNKDNKQVQQPAAPERKVRDKQSAQPKPDKQKPAQTLEDIIGQYFNPPEEVPAPEPAVAEVSFDSPIVPEEPAEPVEPKTRNREKADAKKASVKPVLLVSKKRSHPLSYWQKAYVFKEIFSAPRSINPYQENKWL